MIKSILTALILPILVLGAFVFTYEPVANFITIWPLKLIELTSVMGNNSEGFYNRWVDASCMFSLTVQSLIIFFTLQIKSSKQKNELASKST